MELFGRPAFGERLKEAKGGVEEGQGRLIFIVLVIEGRDKLGIGAEAVLGEIGAADEQQPAAPSGEQNHFGMKDSGNADRMQQVANVGQLRKGFRVLRGCLKQILVLAV